MKEFDDQLVEARCGSHVPPRNDPSSEELSERKEIGQCDGSEHWRRHEPGRKSNQYGKREVIDEEEYKRGKDFFCASRRLNSVLDGEGLYPNLGSCTSALFPRRISATKIPQQLNFS